MKIKKAYLREIIKTEIKKNHPVDLNTEKSQIPIKLILLEDNINCKGRFEEKYFSINNNEINLVLTRKGIFHTI
jgi:hypothetical protein